MAGIVRGSIGACINNYSFISPTPYLSPSPNKTSQSFVDLLSHNKTLYTMSVSYCTAAVRRGDCVKTCPKLHFAEALDSKTLLPPKLVRLFEKKAIAKVGTMSSYCIGQFLHNLSANQALNVSGYRKENLLNLIETIARNLDFRAPCSLPASLMEACKNIIKLDVEKHNTPISLSRTNTGASTAGSDNSSTLYSAGSSSLEVPQAQAAPKATKGKTATATRTAVAAPPQFVLHEFPKRGVPKPSVQRNFVLHEFPKNGGK